MPAQLRCRRHASSAATRKKFRNHLPHVQESLLLKKCLKALPVIIEKAFSLLFEQKKAAVDKTLHVLQVTTCY